jgi:hypothetical protein
MLTNDVRLSQRKGRKPRADVCIDGKRLNRKLSRNRGSIHVRARHKVFLYTHSVWLAIALIANRATLKHNGQAKETQHSVGVRYRQVCCCKTYGPGDETKVGGGSLTSCAMPVALTSSDGHILPGLLKSPRQQNCDLLPIL